MRHLLTDREHLVRLAALFAGALVAFVLVRAALVPEGFGTLGHYRAGALTDASSRPLTFAGRKACADCHGDVAEALAGGAHASVGCEACHGPLGAHAADPTSANGDKPEPVRLCPVCHARNAAKPRGFPQVDVREHALGASCADCHQPHRPGV